MTRLENKVAVVTGSAGGIGKGIALRLAREGADIVLNDMKADELEATAGEVEALGRKAATVVADISTAQGAKRLIDTAIEKFGKVDIMVNNAGVPSHNSLLDTTEGEWDRVQSVDLKGVFLCTQAVARYMMKQKYGKIVNISSSGVGASTATAAYASAKAGVIQLTKTSARELGPYGINVNSVAPGTVVTDLTFAGRTPEQVERAIENRKKTTILGRVATPEDIAGAVAFLVSDDASFITAQTIFCDGGRIDRM